MHEFCKQNKTLVLAGILSLFAIGVGLVLNNAGIIIGASFGVFLSIRETIRKFFRQQLYFSWVKDNEGKCLVNFSVEDDVESSLLQDNAAQIKSLLGDNFIVLPDEHMKHEILYELATRNGFDLDSSVMVQISNLEIEIKSIETQLDLYLKKEIDLKEFITRLKWNS